MQQACTLFGKYQFLLYERVYCNQISCLTAQVNKTSLECKDERIIYRCVIEKKIYITFILWIPFTLNVVMQCLVIEVHIQGVYIEMLWLLLLSGKSRRSSNHANKILHLLFSQPVVFLKNMFVVTHNLLQISTFDKYVA